MKCPYCDGTGELIAGKASIGILIHAARKRAGLKQEELAAKVGVSRAHIANIETGRSQFPLNSVRKFAEALGVSLEELIP